MSARYDLPRSFSVDGITIRIGRCDYEWAGGFGAVLASYERGVTVGSTRSIAGVIFHAYMVYRPSERWPWQKPRVCWTIPNDAICAEWIRGFKSLLMLGEPSSRPVETPR